MKLRFLPLLCVPLSCSAPADEPPTVIMLNFDQGTSDGAVLDPDGGALDPDVGPPRQSFDLMVNVTTAGNAGGTLPIFLAVRDAETDEVLAFEQADYRVGELSVDLPAVMKRNGNYEVGVATRYDGCPDQREGWTRAVLYESIDSVVDDVVLDLEMSEDAENDFRGCEVLHHPVGLPPGRYDAEAPILGDGQNKVVYTVSETGRIYERQAFVLCPDAGCYPSLLVPTSALCIDRTPLPGVTTIPILGGSQDGKTTLMGEAKIDEAAGYIVASGETATGSCCSSTFDATLVRVSSETDSCF